MARLPMQKHGRIFNEESFRRDLAEFMRDYGYDLRSDLQFNRDLFMEFMEDRYDVHPTGMTATECLLHVFDRKKLHGRFGDDERAAFIGWLTKNLPPLYQLRELRKQQEERNEYMK